MNQRNMKKNLLNTRKEKLVLKNKSKMEEIKQMTKKMSKWMILN
jgi:hypothetical protein